jgi:hypothetical protein
MTVEAHGDSAGDERPGIDPGGSSDTEDEYRHLRAHYALFGELVPMFAHDLSNPLQGLTVLLELLLDDIHDGSDAHGKVRQSLEASDRMRTLIRDFAGLARAARRPAAPSPCEASVARASGVLRRRFERNGIRLRLELGVVGEVQVPSAALELGLLAVLLAVLELVDESVWTALEVTTRGRVLDPGPRSVACIEVGITGHRAQDRAVERVMVAAAAIERARDILAGSAVQVSALPTGEVRFHFPIDAEAAL